MLKGITYTVRRETLGYEIQAVFNGDRTFIHVEMTQSPESVNLDYEFKAAPDLSYLKGRFPFVLLSDWGTIERYYTEMNGGATDVNEELLEWRTLGDFRYVLMRGDREIARVYRIKSHMWCHDQGFGVFKTAAEARKAAERYIQ